MGKSSDGQATIPVATPTAMRSRAAVGRWWTGWNMYTCPSAVGLKVLQGTVWRVGSGVARRGPEGKTWGRGREESSSDDSRTNRAALKEQDAAIYPRNRTAHLLRNRLYFPYLQNLR